MSTQSPEPRRSRSNVSTVTRTVALAACMTLLLGALTGCGVRFETPAPSEPVPDAHEVLRRTAVHDAENVAEMAAGVTGNLSEDLVTELARVAADAQSHVDALGGEYVSGLAGLDEEDGDGATAVTGGSADGSAADGSANGSPAPDSEADSSADGTSDAASDAVENTPEEFVNVLVDSAARMRLGTNTTDDGDLARLLASIAAAQAVAAVRVATLAGLHPVPTFDVREFPEPGSAPGGDPTPAATHALPQPTAVETTDPANEPLTAPLGMTSANFAAVTETEDAARYAMEVAAALASGNTRNRLLARSRVHMTRADGWARLAHIADTDQDPRRVAYVIPEVGDPKALVQAIETANSTNYASLISTTQTGTRVFLADLLTESAVAMNAWGVAPVAFPGMPETAAS